MKQRSYAGNSPSAALPTSEMSITQFCHHPSNLAFFILCKFLFCIIVSQKQNDTLAITRGFVSTLIFIFYNKSLMILK